MGYVSLKSGLNFLHYLGSNLLPSFKSAHTTLKVKHTLLQLVNTSWSFHKSHVCIVLINFAIYFLKISVRFLIKFNHGYNPNFSKSKIYFLRILIPYNLLYFNL